MQLVVSISMLYVKYDALKASWLLIFMGANWFKVMKSQIDQSIDQGLFSIQTNNNSNINTFVNMNTERAGNEVILLI